MILLLVILGIALLVVLWGVSLYNSLVKARTMVAEGWSGIEVQLKRRANLIPNLIETVKGYMGHERETLDEVTELRAKSLAANEPPEQGRVEGLLSGALGRLMAVAESYPDLKASANFIELQESLAEVEEQIQLSRRYYNGAVRELNIKVDTFPSNLIATRFGFTKAQFFELEDQADAAVPQVDFKS